jgi:predicted component of type VI protein secretion system
MLQIAGRLLREALISLKVLDSKQAEFRRQFRLPPVRDDDRQPFRLAGTTDELLTALFASHGSRRIDAGQWLRACYDQQAFHQEALASGARDGCLEFMRKISPVEQEKRFAATAKRGATGSKPGNWELYTEYYRSASEVQPDTGVPSLYAETLASAYSQAFKKQSG